MSITYKKELDLSCNVYLYAIVYLYLVSLFYFFSFCDVACFFPTTDFNKYIFPSLSMKLAKGIDNPTFGSPTPRFPYKNEDAACDTYSLPSSPNPSISSFQARTIPLSRLCSHSGDTSDPINASSLLESRSQRNSGSLESYVRNGQFHFSIYKWAGKGVSLTLPCTPKERNGKVSGLWGFPEVVIQGIDLLANDEISIVTGAPKSQMEDADYKLGNDHSMEREDVDPKIFKDVLPAESRRKSLQSYINEESGIWA